MTLAQNAQEPLPTSAKLDEAHGLYADHPLMHEAIRQIRLAQHHASRLALFAEWSAGEGLDFEAAQEAGRAATDAAEEEWWKAYKPAFIEALNAQHRARLAAEREKWVAEVETLRGERDEAVGVVAKQARDWTVATIERDETRKALSTAEARVQRLEAGLKQYGRHAYPCTGMKYSGGSETGIPFCDCGFSALLPEETTK